VFVFVCGFMWLCGGSVYNGLCVVVIMAMCVCVGQDCSVASCLVFRCNMFMGRDQSSTFTIAANLSSGWIAQVGVCVYTVYIYIYIYI